MNRLSRLFLLAAVLLRAQTPDDPLTAAKSQLQNGALPEAEAGARAYLREHSNSAAGHFLLGSILFRQTKARESLAEYTEGAKYQHPSAADLRVVGADYVILADYGDADKWFSKAVELDATNVLGWYYLGRTKYNENRFEEAIAAFERCLKLAPRHVRAEDNLALSLQGLGRYAEAEEAFRSAIAWQADAPAKDPWPYIDLGSLFLEINQPEKAEPYLKQAVDLVPGSPKAHRQLGKAYLGLRELPKAQSELEESVKLEPKNAPAHYMLGQLYQKQGRSEKAKQEFARYSELNAKPPTTDAKDAAGPN